MNMVLRRSVAAAAVLMLAVAVQAGTYENTTRRMAAGDFDGDGVNEVAYIDATGQIVVHDFNNATRSVILPGTTAGALTAADLNGDGVPEIAYINSATNGLQSYNVATSTQTSYAHGTPLATLSAKNVTPDASDELMLLSTGGTVTLWDNGAFSVPGGGLSQISSGSVTFSGDGRTYDFVGRNSGKVPYAYDVQTNHWRGLGGSVLYTTTGNVIANDVDDEVFASNDGKLVYTNNNGWTYTNGTTAPGLQGAIGTGRPDADLAAGRDMGYVVGAGNIVYQSKLNWSSANNGNSGYNYLPTDASTSAGRVAGNAGWGDILLADVTGDGLDEVVVRPTGNPDQLHTYENGDGGFSYAQTSSMPVTTGLKLWLDASDGSTIVSDGTGAIQQWSDKSGSGNHATQPTAGERPVLNSGALNGKPAVRFDGSDDGMVIADSLSLGRPYTVFIVDQYYGAPHGRTLQSRDANWLVGKWGDRNAYYASGFVYEPGAGNHSTAIGEAIGNTGTNGSRYYLDGTHVSTDVSPGGSPGRLGFVGEGQSSGEQSAADVAEVLIFDRVLTKGERHDVGFYLGQKYGLATGYQQSSTHVSGTMAAFSGADPGEGLDLDGTFAYAVNVGGPNTAVGGLTFTDNTATPGFTLTADHHIPAWVAAPAYGNSPADDGLETVMHSMRWSDYTPPRSTIDITMDVIAGTPYHLQLLFSENILNRQPGSRVIDMLIDGREVDEYFDINAIMGYYPSGSITRGGVFSYTFFATSDVLNIRLSGAAIGTDANPILNGLTLEVIPEPMTMLAVGMGLAGLGGYVRKRRRA